MDKVLAVARREFLATVRTKAFVLTIVMMPLLLLLSFLGTQGAAKMSQNEAAPTRRIAVVDESGAVTDDFEAELRERNREYPNQLFAMEAIAPQDADMTALRAAVREGEYYAVAVIPAAALDPSAAAACELIRRDRQYGAGRQLHQMMSQAVVAERLSRLDLNRKALAVLQTPAAARDIDAETGEPLIINEMTYMVMPFAFMFLLMMGTFTISQGLLTSLIEEKGSRIIEVLLSAVSPTQLMAGKILGTVLAGAVLLSVWGGLAYFGASQMSLNDAITGQRLAIAAMYFVPGFLLIATILAAIGSACNDLKDAQGMVFPVSLLTMVPLVFSTYILENPASAVSLALSYVPPITPFVMMLRVCADPHTPTWQVASTLAVLWGSVLAALWAAGKVFRVGVLMYGKPPSVRELLRWVRYS